MVFFIGFFTEGLEPIVVQQSGGELLPPVQTMVATFILLNRSKMYIESNKGKQIFTLAASLFI